jgi:hypothetical protein
MKNIAILTIAILLTISLSAQVGIGTITPDASAVLDISSTDKGVLIPRVALSNVADTMLDGVNTAATGLLIYNTNATVTGGSGVGYYYFNGTTWERLVTTATSTGDADWYEEGTTTSPNDINDEIYTLGYVAIGKNTANFRLDVEETLGNRAINSSITGTDNASVFNLYNSNSNSGSGNHFGVFNLVDGVGTGSHHGVSNFLSGTNTGTKYGVLNTLSSAGVKYGIRNNITQATNSSATGVHNDINSSNASLTRGFYNSLDNSGAGIILGLQNDIGGTGNGDHFGVSSTLNGTGTGRKVGSYSFVPASAGGTHYGVLSNILKSGSFAGFFVGDVAIGTINPFGTGTPDHYVLPSNRGTVNQVMQTDGSGNLSWVDPSTLSDEDWIVDTSGSTVLYPTNTSDDVAIGKTSAFAKLDVERDGGGVTAAFNQINSGGTTGAITNTVSGNAGAVNGISNTIDVSGSGEKNGLRTEIRSGTAGVSGDTRGVYNIIDSETGSAYGVRTELSGNSGNLHVGVSNELSGAGNSSKYGIINTISGNGLGHYGIQNTLFSSNSASKYGVRNAITTNDGISYGVDNIFNGTSDQTQVGTRNQITVSGSGFQYGTYNNLASDGTGVQFGTLNQMSNTAAASQYATYNSFTNSSVGDQTGVRNDMLSADNNNKTGMYTQFTGSGSGLNTGVENRLAGTGHGNNFGVYNNLINSGGGIHYGVRNNLTGAGSGVKYGSYNFISSTAGGTHYGVYSSALKANSFAGYFQGAVAIGTTGVNTYTLPASRGTLNQIMQTDGAGNVSWVAPSTIGAVGATNGTTLSGGNILLGGGLTQNTTITANSFDMQVNLNNTGSGNFIVSDAGINKFQISNAGFTFFGEDTYWRDGSTTGTNIAYIVDDGDDGIFRLLENSAISVDLDANSQFVFNEQGLDRNFRVESLNQSNMFLVDSGTDRIGIREAVPGFDIHLKQSDLLENGSGGLGFESSTSTNTWKIYHSGSFLSFAENGVRRAYIQNGTGNYVTTSDRNLKKSIRPVADGVLRKLEGLEVYTYLYKTQEDTANRIIGFMAQDVQPLFPELVSVAENGDLGLNYDGFGPVAIKAIKEQQMIIEAQQTEIDQLKLEIQEIKRMLQRKK